MSIVGFRLIGVLIMSISLGSIAQASLTEAIDWPTFLSRNDMHWPELPKNWDTAAYLGNGQLGAMFQQDSAGDLRIEFSRSDLYDHRKTGDGMSTLFAHCRLPNGSFRLGLTSDEKLASKLSGKMRLDLWNAKLTGTISSDAGKATLRSIVQANRDVLVVEIDVADPKTKPTISWRADESKATRTNPPAGYTAYPPQQENEVDGIHVSVQEMPEDGKYRTDGLGAGQYATAWKLISLAPGRFVLLASLRFSYPGRTAADEAVERIRQAEKDGLARLKADHEQWWHDFYRKSFISLPNGAIESFYWIQIYKMGSAARQGGPMIDLNGPWWRTTNWPAIWWNLNVQLTYWPFYTANHLPEAQTLIDTLWDHRAALANNAGKYSADSYSISRATSLDCVGPVGAEIGNLPWTMHNLWLHYRCCMDDNLLREKIFPLMKGSFRYLHHLSINRPDGSLALPPTVSPEYRDQPVDDCSYTLACYRWLAKAIIEADNRLKTDDPIVADCRDVLKRLVDYPVDEKTGLMVGKDLPFAKSHRHWSHLFMIYPFYEWTWEDPSRRPLMEKSLAHWTDHTEAFAGYSWLGAASMWAAEGDGERSLKYVRDFLHKSPQPNTLYREGGGPVIETPLQAARVIQEMLLTSHGDRIRIFPAVPAEWADVAFADLRAEGAFLVSAKRVGGKTQWVSITSIAGEPCRVATGFADKVSIAVADNAKLTNEGAGLVSIDLKKGQTVLLYSGELPNDTSVNPVGRIGAYSPWGLNRSEP